MDDEKMIAFFAEPDAPTAFEVYDGFDKAAQVLLDAGSISEEVYLKLNMMAGGLTALIVNKRLGPVVTQQGTVN